MRGAALLIEFEVLAMSPNISAVMRNVDWDVAHQAHIVLQPAIPPERTPLPEKKELAERVFLRSRRQFLPPILKG